MKNDKNTFISKFPRSKILKKNEFILQNCEGKVVLDVGCVGQDLSVHNNDWLHKKIKNISKSIEGVDINSEGIRELNQKGFTIYHLNDFKTFTKKYDLIIMGDVIEHVDNICDFLNFYARFLNKDGKMIISTPNPLNFRQFLSVFLYKKPSVNEEHTSWLDPIVCLEIFNRCNLKIEKFTWLKEYTPPLNLQQKIIHFFSKIAYSIRKYYSPNFAFIVYKDNG